MHTSFRGDHYLLYATLIGVAVISVVALAYVFHDALGFSAVRWVVDLADMLLAIACTLGAGILWQSFEKGETLRRVWGLLALGLLLWAVGETMWAINELILGIDPYPSVADVTYVAAYVPLFVALITRYRSLRVMPPRGHLIGVLSAYGVLVVITVVFVIRPMLIEPDLERPTELVLNVLYPLGDLSLAFALALSVLVILGGEFSRPWMFITAGLLTIAVYDLLFSYATWREIYLVTGASALTALIDVLYVVGYVVLGIGIYMQAWMQEGA